MLKAHGGNGFEDYRVEAARQLFYWQTGSDSFSAHIFTLCGKADPANYRRLKRGFPFLVAAYEEWCKSPHPDDFYKKYGVG